MIIKDLFGYLKTSVKFNKCPFPVESIEICEGDDYNNEHGEDLIFEILGKRYSVGYSYITEDRDDWAQAECYETTWCRCDGYPIDKQIVLELILNYKSEVRDSIIDEIVK